MDPYLKLLGLMALLFFVPKFLVRVRLPSPVSEMALGVLLGPLALNLVEPAPLLLGLAGIGISSLFLFAGLEVELHELLQRRAVLLQHLTIQVILFAAAAAVALRFGVDLPQAVLVAVGIMSASAGFIVPALEGMGLPPPMASWIKQKAIAAELLAILAVLLLVNTSSGRDLLVGIGGIVALLAGVPLLFIAFHATILRWVPRTEISFVMIVALGAAYATHALGVHYLVGAFLVGLVARRYLDWSAIRGTTVGSVDVALASFRFFSAFFVPFFFFLAGLRLPRGALSLAAVLFALLVFAAGVPLRVFSVMVHRRLGLGESWRDALNVGLLLGPTTVFSVAVAEILFERFAVPEWLVGGLILYGAATSLLPLLTRRPRSTEYEDVLPLQEMTVRPKAISPP